MSPTKRNVTAKWSVVNPGHFAVTASMPTG